MPVYGHPSFNYHMYDLSCGLVEPRLRLFEGLLCAQSPVVHKAHRTIQAGRTWNTTVHVQASPNRNRVHGWFRGETLHMRRRGTPLQKSNEAKPFTNLTRVRWWAVELSTVQLVQPQAPLH